MEAQRKGKSAEWRLADNGNKDSVALASQVPVIKLINLPAVNSDETDEHSRHLHNLVDDVIPIINHVVRFHQLQAFQRIHVFWLDPRQSLEDAGRQLLEFLAGLSGSRCLWVPLTSSHSSLVNAMSMVLPGLQCLDLASVVMIYIGDHGNCMPMRRMAEVCHMPFYFQASF